MSPIAFGFDGKQGPLCVRGTDFAAQVRFLESDGLTPLDFTGASARMQIKAGFDQPAALTLTSQGNQILFPGDGVIAWAVARTATEQLTVALEARANRQPATQTYVYDLLLTMGGLAFVKLYGPFVVAERVTALS
jgi:hypothetical protein